MEEPKNSVQEIVSELELELNSEPDHGRKRPPLGTVPYITGTFGLMIANIAIDEIIN